MRSTRVLGLELRTGHQRVGGESLGLDRPPGTCASPRTRSTNRSAGTLRHSRQESRSPGVGDGTPAIVSFSGPFSFSMARSIRSHKSLDSFAEGVGLVTCCELGRDG